MKLHPIRTLLKIVDRIIVCIIVPSIVVYLIRGFFLNGWIALIIEILIFIIIYVILLLNFGLNLEEKSAFNKVKIRFVKEKK